MVTLRLQQDALYQPRSDTDYKRLAMQISMLDIGIDDAFAAECCATPASTIAFDSDVDAMAGPIRALFTQIVDGGAGNMIRTEAKSVVERLLYRLDYGVRSRPPPRKSALNYGRRSTDVGDSSAAQASLMMKFLKKKREHTEEQVTQGLPGSL